MKASEDHDTQPPTAADKRSFTQEYRRDTNQQRPAKAIMLTRKSHEEYKECWDNKRPHNAVEK